MKSNITSVAGRRKQVFQYQRTPWHAGTDTARSHVLSVQLLHFILGFCIGVVLYELYHVQEMALRSVNPFSSNQQLWDVWDAESFILENTNFLTSETEMGLGSHYRKHRERSSTKRVANRRISGNPRILCLIPVQPSLEQEFIDAINSTWGQQCDYLLLLSEGKQLGYDNEALVNKKIVSTEEKWDWKPCWNKICPNSVWNSLYSSPNNKFDWVVRPFGEAYVVIPNLKYVLSQYNSSLPLYFGNSQPVDDNLKVIDAPVQILSRAAVRELTPFQTTNKCNVTNYGLPLSSLNIFRRNSGFSEIMECVKNAKMGIIRPYDAMNRPYFTSNLLYEEISATAAQNIFGAGNIKGFECCSDLMIAFKVLERKDVYKYHLLINQIHPFGISPPH